MFGSIVVLSRDLGSILLRKSLSQNSKAADGVIAALRDRRDKNPEEESTVVVQQNADEVGVFLEINDVIILGVVEQEVGLDQGGWPCTGLSATPCSRRHHQVCHWRTKNDQSQREDGLTISGKPDLQDVGLHV